MTAVPQELKGCFTARACRVLLLGTRGHLGACRGSKWERESVPENEEKEKEVEKEVVEEEEEESHMSSCDNLIKN
ncbi:hypothetical protein E2C01_071614 [Portunus trituberculatus]|uniref:Uncharacterized protein n=1 Tax=Portunus trituberculatus TaxID=210409 RepID=A0A5B7I6N7_PORTR|nr:hypothetical protein [Portunus trituberculatus]